VSVAHEMFPYRLENLRGKVRMAGGSISINNITGRRGPFTCNVNGAVRNMDDGEKLTVDIAVRGRNFPLDENLLAALQGKARKRVASLNAAGRAREIQARLHNQPGEQVTFDVSTTLDGASFRWDAFPVDVQDVSGDVKISPRRVVIGSVRGRRGKAGLTFSGQVFLESGGVDLAVDAGNLELDKELRDALPEVYRNVWKDFAPDGRADIRLSVRHQTPEQADGQSRYRLEIAPRDLRVTWAPLPVPLRMVAGRAVVRPGRVTLDDLTAREEKMSLALAGDVAFDPNRIDARLRLRSRNLPVDQALLDALPGRMTAAAERVRPGGTVDLDLETLHIVHTPSAAAGRHAAAQPARGAATVPASAPSSQPAEDGQLDWRLAGLVGVDGVSVAVGREAKKLTGKLTGEASRQDGKLSLETKLAVERMGVGGLEATDLSGTMAKSPASEVIVVRGLSGKFGGGWIGGEAELRLGEPVRCALDVGVRNVDLKELMAAQAGDDETPEVSGLLDGSLQLIETMGQPAKRRAAGTLRIRKAQIVRMPVLLGLMHVMYLSIPGDSVFTGGHVDYHLKGNRMVFREIHLEGNAMGVLGSGEMEVDSGKLDLSFLAGPAGKVPGIRQIAQLLGPIIKEVVVTRVTGTLANPEMRTVPLQGLDDALQILLRAGERPAG
ncbi:MAG: hypothetical protein ACOC93_04520, partial [Planctomycetota bacterium]